MGKTAEPPGTDPKAGREGAGSTKARILAAAEAVFARRGFDGASTREIAAAAGVNISSLHYHWESKETLYVGVLRDIYERLNAELQRTMAPLLAEHRPKHDVLVAAMGRIFAFFGERPTLPRLLLRWIIDEESIDIGIDRDVLTPAWSGAVAWLGTQRTSMPEIDAKLFVLTVHSVALMYLVDSQSFRRFLGGSVHDLPLNDQVQRHLVTLMQHLLPA